ncbi:hypothetical protein [Hydrogenovibrio marinus]|uniref:Replication protein n=1 Tax=Hydrogenovibrio marinus TaxID=28885 RepID=A0A066ZSX1_HYDMR|nr:hypothetical protein [Hydrogenovibrio marinus]KDN96587.1 hypothetical protein EI16_10055 [Hydrogenovibrio marinus]BBN60203.1 hypothetical protein HVMH_1797 [Hydrogenovibrio marinus]
MSMKSTVQRAVTSEIKLRQLKNHISKDNLRWLKYKWLPEYLYNIEEECHDFETIEQAVLESYKRQQLLKKQLSKCDQQGRKCLKRFKQQASDLLFILQYCSPEAPCNSHSCPICARESRRKLSNMLIGFGRQSGGGFKAMTVIYYNEIIRSQEFFEMVAEDVVRIKDKLRKQLSRSGYDDVVFGGFEVCYDRELKIWIPHFHLFTLVSDKRSERKLRYMLNTKRNSFFVDRKHVPLKIEEVFDFPCWATYTMKSDFFPKGLKGRISPPKLYILGLIKRHEYGLKLMQFGFKVGRNYSVLKRGVADRLSIENE